MMLDGANTVLQLDLAAHVRWPELQTFTGNACIMRHVSALSKSPARAQA